MIRGIIRSGPDPWLTAAGFLYGPTVRGAAVEGVFPGADRRGDGFGFGTATSVPVFSTETGRPVIPRPTVIAPGTRPRTRCAFWFTIALRSFSWKGTL
ncbi:MAG TPA: hypothetical protein VFG76_00230, partial [Candidatus Polarisedimenticolia bacterium]|nr:hypothetical protein [Candidatus Polarisedimenticolia bacterium]